MSEDQKPPEVNLELSPQEIMAKMKELYPTREDWLLERIVQGSGRGIICDVTFYGRAPALSVKFDREIARSLLYGASVKEIAKRFDPVRLSDGTTARLDEIWTINPMPHDGFSQEELDAVDLADGDKQAGLNGETVRKMIGDTYHCKSRDEEDRCLRRRLAS